MPRARPLPAVLSAAFTVGEAREAGVPPHRLRSRDLDSPFYGIRSREPIGGVAARARAYAPLLRAGEHFSHATAVALVGGWIPDRLRDAVDVSAVRPVGRARGRGVRGHEASHAADGRVAGMPIAPPADAWCQLAASLTERELVIAGDSLLRRGQPITDLDELCAAADRAPGRRGVTRLRAALVRVRARTDSVAETELRLDAADAGLPEPEVNGEIRDHGGRLIAYGDLTYRRQKVLLEYDGEQHRIDDRQFARDLTRLDDLARLGWRVIRVTKRHRGAERRARLERVREALAASDPLPPSDESTQTARSRRNG